MLKAQVFRFLKAKQSTIAVDHHRSHINIRRIRRIVPFDKFGNHRGMENALTSVATELTD